jgi:hypothetical protein
MSNEDLDQLSSNLIGGLNQIALGNFVIPEIAGT